MFALNPYIAGNPVGNSDAFVGRVDVLREVRRVLRHPQNNAIVLYGQRRIGKTSVLQQLENQLHKQGPYQPVFFDLQDKATLSLERVLQDLARKISDTVGQTIPDLGKNLETAFRQWLPQLLKTLSAETSLVLLFDEFDVLADPKVEQAGAAFFPYLRDLLTIDLKRLNFVFVIGRNVGDLSNIALSLFKGTPSKRVSLLSQEDATTLVRLSENNDSLYWPDNVIETVWQLTSGHPFLTQHLCSQVWDTWYDDDPDEAPTVTIQDVETAIPNTLEISCQALEWLWGGLPPAERVVASALAEAGAKVISDSQLEHLLYESGVRVVIRELQNAPQLLQEWDLLESVEGGYRFRVELLRRWIAKNKPLKRVQDELDRIEPAADSLYNAGLSLYRSGSLDAALSPLRQAIGLNPNHVGANQLLADILLAQEKPSEAREILEKLYEYQPAAARPRLIQALLALAQSSKNEDEQLKLYEQVLELDAEQPEAKSGWQKIWRQRGDKAYKVDALEVALSAYQIAQIDSKVAEVEKEIRNRHIEAQLKIINQATQENHYKEALEKVQQLAKEYPQKRDWVKIEQEIQNREFEARLKKLNDAEQTKRYEDALEQAQQLANQYPEKRDWTKSIRQLKRRVKLAKWKAKLAEWYSLVLYPFSYILLYISYPFLYVLNKLIEIQNLFFHIKDFLSVDIGNLFSKSASQKIPIEDKIAKVEQEKRNREFEARLKKLQAKRYKDVWESRWWILWDLFWYFILFISLYYAFFE